MLKSFLFLILLSSIIACNDQEKSTGDGMLKVNDFMDAFKTLKLPYTIADSNMNNLKDTSTISYAVFSKFIPDTVLNMQFAKDRNVLIHPIGKFEKKGAEIYFVTHIQSKSQSGVYVFVFDKNKKFASTLPLLTSKNENNYSYNSTIDNRFSIALNKEWKDENELLYNRTIYAYNSAGMFTVVLTETNDQSHLSGKINNPLDTLPQLNKFSGNYIKGKKNFLFLRDGKNASSYLFYVRFENDTDEACVGELKGDLVLKDDNSAVFAEIGDPCVVNFTFTKNNVKVKENGSCGNHRGIKCFFDHTYVKKPTPAAKK